jgi:Domain of unknown function (DUF4214)
MRYLLAATVAGLLFLTAGTARAQDPAQLVQSWYEKYLGREADPGGLAVWTQQLETLGPAQAEAGVLASDEYYARHGSSPVGFVEGLYADVLGRTPSADEVDNWVSRLMVDGGNRAQLAQEFLAAAQPELTGQGGTPAPVYGAYAAAPTYGAYSSPAYGYYGGTYGVYGYYPGIYGYFGSHPGYHGYYRGYGYHRRYWRRR